ncbi:ABC transporter substrate-binding protein [Bordetella genomosp. 10]|uniref:ABC transporter substrate-binding protein n=1 Tax=Bordetella genomosp. 10 TaxID=1416804 RepID=A0A261S402_9BORD|nr:tripartite tricarboxylate transporter substrate binding protein [Bordetella genomosp. 10]OZI32078.1 ABC transporter substrate-binding protein [Bordetella genomosp. 10]
MRRFLFRPRARRARCLIVGACLIFPAWHAGAAETWPARPVRIIVPYGPGGAVDVATRKMAQLLGEQTGQSFVVENRVGASGSIAVSQVARSPGDGYTLLADDTGYSLLPFIFRKLPFDPDRDLLPVSAFVFAPMVLLVKADGPYQTLASLLDKARQQPGKITYATGGAGTTPHFVSEALGMAAGVKFMHIPYTGSTQGTQAVLSGLIDFQFASTTGVMGPVQAGQLRLLAISGDARLGILPNVPTFAEAGVRNFKGVVNWTGLWAPRGTPQPVLDRLQQEVATAMNSPAMKDYARQMGAENKYVGAADFAKLLRESNALWSGVAQNINFRSQ